MLEIVIALFLALLVGLTLGLLGGGGSILTLPVLQYVLGVEAHAAVAASLFVVATTSLFALVPHARGGRIAWRTGVVFGVASMAGAFGAGRLAAFIPPGILLVLFALMMLVTAIAMLRGRRWEHPASSRARPLVIALEGIVVGAITGLVGAGGGFLVVPALTLLGGLPMATAVGTSLLVIALKSFAGFAGHAGAVTLDWPLVLGFSAAAVVGSAIGAPLAARVPTERLRRAFGWFVVVMGVFMLAQEIPALVGLPRPVGVALGLAGVMAAVAAAIEHQRNINMKHVTGAHR